MAEFGVQKPWEQPPKTNASKSRSRTKRQRKQKALRIEAGTHLPLVWALPDGVASGIAAIAPNIDRKQIAALTSTVTKSLQSGAASVVSKLQ